MTEQEQYKEFETALEFVNPLRNDQFSRDLFLLFQAMVQYRFWRLSAVYYWDPSMKHYLPKDVEQRYKLFVRFADVVFGGSVIPKNQYTDIFRMLMNNGVDRSTMHLLVFRRNSLSPDEKLALNIRNENS